MTHALRGEVHFGPKLAAELIAQLAARVPEATVERPRRVPDLTRREQQILDQIGQGLSNKEIARLLGISSATVKNHVQRLFGKLSVRRRTQAIAVLHGHPVAEIVWSRGRTRSPCSEPTARPRRHRSVRVVASKRSSGRASRSGWPPSHPLARFLTAPISRSAGRRPAMHAAIPARLPARRATGNNGPGTWIAWARPSVPGPLDSRPLSASTAVKPRSAGLLETIGLVIRLAGT